MPASSPVDETVTRRPVDGRLGLVLPKRLAKRAVTRTLMKGQARAICRQFAADLPAGDWVLRLRAPFDVKQFPSAASLALKQVVRLELLSLFAQACEKRA